MVATSGVDKSLLLSEEAWQLPPELHSCWNARGLYNPLQFVLRLRPDLHRALDSAPSGIVELGTLSVEQFSAFSTYLHETIHWWQHAGSTTGLFLSLIYPAQSHLNHRHLKKILEDLGPKKSLREYNLQKGKSDGEQDELGQALNIVLNNWHDIEFYRWLVVDPRGIADRLNDRYFECAGHSYHVAIGAVIWLLSSTIDPDLVVLQDPRPWDSKMHELRDSQVEGFYYGSRVTLPLIGAREIFEGQARFSQLQYLHLSTRGELGWEEFARDGMLKGIYVEAFECFLKVTGLESPPRPDDPIVGLFLLICDVSINPAECFVEQMADFGKLIKFHDPGYRFLQLCLAIRDSPSSFVYRISKYSSEEYWSVSEMLCRAAGFASPRVMVEKVNSWPYKLESIKELLEEDRVFKFAQENLPVRVFLARFIRIQQDKLTTPEFFCWPGVWMTTQNDGSVAPEKALSLFDDHRALFVDREDGDVYPRSFSDREEAAVQETFNSFYSWIATYELTRQWMVGQGNFDFDFSWLSTKHGQAEIQAWASARFKEAFGIAPEDFEIV